MGWWDITEYEDDRQDRFHASMMEGMANSFRDTLAIYLSCCKDTKTVLDQLSKHYSITEREMQMIEKYYSKELDAKAKHEASHDKICSQVDCNEYLDEGDYSREKQADELHRTNEAQVAQAKAKVNVQLEQPSLFDLGLLEEAEAPAEAKPSSKQSNDPVQ